MSGWAPAAVNRKKDGKERIGEGGNHVLELGGVEGRHGDRRGLARRDGLTEVGLRLLPAT